MRLFVFAAGIFVAVALATTQGRCAGPSETSLPPAAAGILTQMDKDIAATKSKAIIALDKILKDTTKKGDLAGAVAVKAAIDQLKAEVEAAQGPRAGRGRADLGSIAGQWFDGSSGVELLADGSCTCREMKATWRLEGDSVEIKWNHGYVYRLKVTPEGLVGFRLNPSGKQDADVRLTRAQ